MILTDGTHLVGHPISELHRFAESIGLKRKWYQTQSRHPHYDIMSKTILNRALEKGAVLGTKKQIVDFIRQYSKEASHA